MYEIINKPLVSVIMPVYNCENYIYEALQSILNQTYTNFEILLIDDKSTDNTLKIIEQFKDERIKLILKEENTGYTNSLNIGLTLANGDFVARMDGDDISVPTRFEKQVKFLELNQNIIACGSWASIIGTENTILVPENHHQIRLALLKKNCMIHSSIMFRKKYIDEFSIKYDVSKEPAEDYDLWVKIAILGKLHNLQEILLHYRIYDTQVSNLQNETQKIKANQSRYKLLNHIASAKNDLEISALKRFIERDLSITFDEIKFFLLELKQRILSSNKDDFFDPKGLENYLNQIETESIKSYFFERKKYRPSIFLNYLKIKSHISLKFSFKDEFKLFLKSLIFYKRKMFK